MTTVTVTKPINVEAPKVWSTLASFRGIEEFSPIERSVTEGEGEGAKRTCYMPDGAAIHEILSKMDHNAMEMEYKITQGPFPVTGYVSTISVRPLENGASEVSWACQFECNPEVAQDMSGLFEGFYNVIIDNLETRLN